jgi:hypothetical protein
VSDTARTPVPRTLWVAVALFAAVLLGILAFHALTDASDPLLAPSGPQETVLRAVRLAGIEHAAVGDADGMALLRIDVPVIASAPDVEIAWQTGFAVLTEAYPAVSHYTVQLFVDAGPLLEVRADGDAVRSAVDADDAASLRSAFEVRFIAAAARLPNHRRAHLTIACAWMWFRRLRQAARKRSTPPCRTGQPGCPTMRLYRRPRSRSLP